MISAEQSAALKTATVDESKVEELAGGKVHLPVDAVIADAEFTEGDRGDYTLAYMDGNWFIVE